MRFWLVVCLVVIETSDVKEFVWSKRENKCLGASLMEGGESLNECSM